MSGSTDLVGRLAVLRDMTEEGWPSMDQMGDLIAACVPAFAPGLAVTPIRHPLVPVVGQGPLGRVRALFFLDRVVNRMVFYPRRVRRQVRGRFDIYHVVDHSYAQLVLDLPGDSTLVTCHDVDTFRSLVDSSAYRRSRLFRLMTKRILRGLRRARIVVCGSAAARDDLVRFGLADPARTRVVPNGIDPRLLKPASAAARQRADEMVPRARGVFDLLHVGSDIPRKRLDRLFEIVSALRARRHRVRVIRVGGPLGAANRRLANRLALSDLVELPFLDPEVLRAVYERADVLLLPSDREGYGLPILEAFAAGKPVVASDIPALRETSAGLATCVQPDDVRGWIEAIEGVLATSREGDTLAPARRSHAALRTWDTHVRGLLPLYAEVLERPRLRHAMPAQALVATMGSGG